MNAPDCIMCGAPWPLGADHTCEISARPVLGIEHFRTADGRRFEDLEEGSNTVRFPDE